MIRAAMNLQHLQHEGLLKPEPEQRDMCSTNPLVAALRIKAKSATAVLQAALNTSPDELTPCDIYPVMLVWEVAVVLAFALANAMAASNVQGRALTAQYTKEILEEQNYAVKGPEDLFLLAPLVARLLCSAVPGFQVFLWLPPRLRYTFLAMQVSTVTSIMGWL